MARHEAEREDLMAEATALRQRAEILVADEPEPVVAGFRADGHWSLYFGADPVYHFNEAGGLRRAFVGGELYRSQGQTLARLSRTRTDEAVELNRRDLDPAALEQFLSQMAGRLLAVKSALERGSATIVRQISDDDDFQSRLIAAIDNALQMKLSKSLTKR